MSRAGANPRAFHTTGQHTAGQHTAPQDPGRPVVVRIHYDFASSLCYVTHRLMARIAHRFAPPFAHGARSDRSRGSAQPPVAFRWSPLDLAGLLNWRRGGRVPDARRANALRVARELDVPVRVPRTWLDSRRANAAAIVLAGRDPSGALEAAWRERVYTAIFEEGRPCDDAAEIGRWARDLGIALGEAEIDAAGDELERRTRAAAEATVTGVPTFMLGEWPMGGIQDGETMVTLLSRFARRARERGTA